MFSLVPVSPDIDGFNSLRQESLAEGHRMLMRFEENWRAGINRFDGPGEFITGLRDDGTLVGICGRNIDPYDTCPRAGRVRHLYVTRSFRQRGAGRRLLTAVLDGAAIYFDYLNTNAPETAFAFYERLGFKRMLNVDHVTHRLFVRPSQG